MPAGLGLDYTLPPLPTHCGYSKIMGRCTGSTRIRMTALSQRARRSLLAIIWIGVGGMLFSKGLRYAGVWPEVWSAEDLVTLTPAQAWWALALALLIGLLKGLTVFRKAAARATADILADGALAPFWRVFRPRMLLLIVLMIAAGLAVRLLPYDAHLKAWIVAIVYPGIGLALMIGGLLLMRDPRVAGAALK